MGIPDGFHFGVDSINNASLILPRFSGGLVPSFLGRYLNGGGNIPLTVKEARYILDRGCRIFLIFIAGTGLVGKDKGSRQALEAIAIADNTLHVPKNKDITIFADVEPGVNVDAGWIMGWWETMYRSEYGGLGGLYVNLSLLNETSPKKPKKHREAVADAYAMFPNYPDASVRLYSQTPLAQGSALDKVPAWKPDTIAHPANAVVIWQYKTSYALVPGLDIDLDLATDDGFQSMWAPDD